MDKDGLTGSRAIVDEAVDDAATTLFTAASVPLLRTQELLAARTLFTAASVPLLRTQELLAALTGPAVRDVLTIRVDQLVKHGHTVEGDLDLPLAWLANDARIRLQSAVDLLALPSHSDRFNLPLARRRVVAAAALCLAQIDVIDATINSQGGN